MERARWGDAEMEEGEEGAHALSKPVNLDILVLFSPSCGTLNEECQPDLGRSSCLVIGMYSASVCADKMFVCGCFCSVFL